VKKLSFLIDGVFSHQGLGCWLQRSDVARSLINQINNEISYIQNLFVLHQILNVSSLIILSMWSVCYPVLPPTKEKS